MKTFSHLLGFISILLHKARRSRSIKIRVGHFINECWMIHILYFTFTSWFCLCFFFPLHILWHLSPPFPSKFVDFFQICAYFSFEQYAWKNGHHRAHCNQAAQYTEYCLPFFHVESVPSFLEKIKKKKRNFEI